MTTPPKESSRPLSLMETFHHLGRILPDDQDLVTVSPDTSAGKALELMARHGFSQLPVKVGKTIIGMFSYRSFSQNIIKCGRSLLDDKQLPEEIEVEELMEQPTFALLTDEFRRWFETLDTKDAILVGQPEHVAGLLTAMDILHYLYKVASPFVLLAEIELSVRNLIRVAVRGDLLQECCTRAKVKSVIPEEMSFGDYVYLITHEHNWQHFHPVFRGNCGRTKTKLEEIRVLRNKAFHFNGEVSTAEYDRLAELRDWILQKSMRTELESQGAQG